MSNEWCYAGNPADTPMTSHEISPHENGIARFTPELRPTTLIVVCEPISVSQCHVVRLRCYSQPRRYAVVGDAGARRGLLG